MSVIDDYILSHRDEFTRTVITDYLVHAGHDPAAIEEAWERLGEVTPSRTTHVVSPSVVALVFLLVGSMVVMVSWSGAYYSGTTGIALMVYAPITFLLVYAAARTTLPRAPRGARLSRGELAAGMIAPLVVLAATTGICASMGASM